MTVRELLHLLEDHSADGRTLDDEVLIRIDGEKLRVDTSHVDGTLILIAGMPVE
jgi:hypothetical protein